MNDRDREPELSAAGMARKAAMLAVLQAELRARKRRRQAAQLCGMAALTLLAAALALSLRPEGKQPASGNPSVSGGPAPFKLENALLEIVGSDPSILERFILRAGSPSRLTVEIIDDSQLLAALAAAHRPMGLARAGGRVILIEETVDEDSSVQSDPRDG